MSTHPITPLTRDEPPTPPLPAATATATLRRRSAWRRRRLAYGLIAPALVVMVLVHLLPAAAGVALSFKNLNTFTFSLLFNAPWNGFENYRSILFDSANPLHSGFFDAARNSIIYTAVTVCGTLGGGLGIALLLHREFPGRRLVRTLMIAPWVVPSFVVAVLWGFMWQSDSGIINKVLVDYTGLLHHRPVWLLGHNSLWAVIIPSVWRGIPLAMLIFLAGLQSMPQELHEAAAIDGAGPWQRFRYITLPLLRPIIAVQLLFGVIYSMYQFTIPYVMLGNNPGPDADLMMTLVVRQSFSNNLFGFGAAASTLLMLAMLVWVAIWFRAFRRDLEAA
ncbi:MAG TPA: sugar ABC transporter permease [Solirubrobacteraceae bacterium]|nr:sugar ABC transporter permease [Solirubrobacteraceae bacterium]